MCRRLLLIVPGFCLATCIWAGGTVTASPGAATPGGGPSHPFAVNLATIGALSCVERGNQIAQFLDPERVSQTLVQAPIDNPNRRLIMATMVLQPQPGHYLLNSLALAPGQANGCAASYHAVAWVNLPCAKAEQTQFPNVKFTRLNQSEVGTAIVSRNMWILSMPAGSGCVIEKEEIVQ
jgi:hypothetical protein